MESDSAHVQKVWQHNRRRDQLHQALGFLGEGNLDRDFKNAEALPSLTSLLLVSCG